MINFHKDIIIRHYYKVTGVPIAMYFFRIHVTLFFVITPLSISPHGGKRLFILSPVQNGFLYLPPWGKARMGVLTLENCIQNSFIQLVT